jgi:hypothetical protein
MGIPEQVTDHSIGHFAVLIESLDGQEWMFYKTTHPTKARQLAMTKCETLRVLRVIMITKGQYETGMHNLKILNDKRNTVSRRKMASRAETQRRKNYNQAQNRKARKQTA